MIKFIKKMVQRISGNETKTQEVKAEQKIAPPQEKKAQDNAAQNKPKQKKQHDGPKKQHNESRKQHDGPKKQRNEPKKPQQEYRAPEPLVAHSLPELKWAGWSEAELAEVPKDKLAFSKLDIEDSIQAGVHALGFKHCTDIQALALPNALEHKDIVGKALTGGGKTAAFLISVINGLLRVPGDANPRAGCPRAVCIAPTRELAQQIERDAQAIGKFCGLNIACIIGGTKMEPQERSVNRRLDILIGTPGRILDFNFRKKIDLRNVEHLVIDEADRMLDMGFIPDMKRIIGRMPNKDKRQNHLYSATFSPEVLKLAQQWLQEDNQAFVEIEGQDMIPKTIEQSMYPILAEQKITFIANVFKYETVDKMIIFCNRKTTTELVANKLYRRGVKIELMSGDIAQNKRESVIKRLKAGDIQAIVATDVAGRGIHVDGITHVVNYDLPYDAEDYVHRVGRTGRAGAKGRSISFACENSAFDLPAIEAYIENTIPSAQIPDGYLEAAEIVHRDVAFESKSRSGGGNRGGNSRGGHGGGNRGGNSRGGHSGGNRSGGGNRSNSQHKKY